MRAGMPGVEIAEADGGAHARDAARSSRRCMSYLHGRFLAHFVEQDVIGHMEADLADGTAEEGRLRVAIAFADLAGYARLTVERGDEEAVGTVERFVEAVEQSAAARRARDQDARRRGDGRRLRSRRAHRVGGRAAGGHRPPRSRRRGSASTTARRSTATATTTGATSTRRRAWSRARRAARCS